MFNRMMAKFTQAVILEHMHFPVDGSKVSVCELGNQTMKPDIMEEYSASKPKHWYSLFGIDEYLALDVNTYNDAVIVDLNEPVNLLDDEGIPRYFDLVTNNGTSEHIFNQYNVFRVMHDHTKEDGIMIHILPYNQADHGFFNYNPNLFACLADANDYEILKAWLGNSPLKNQTNLDLKLERQTNLDEEHSLHLWEPGWGVSIAVAFRKRKEHPFKMPLQNLYAAGNADQTVLRKYSG